MATTQIQFRWMEPDEVTKIKDVDRSERIRSGYQYVDGELQQIAVNWDAPPWATQGDGEYTVRAQIRFCQGHLGRNGRLYGAFSGDKLVGVGIIQPDIAPGTAQLAYLHVSQPYRHYGIGKQIAETLMNVAQKMGADRMYVSATPSASTVGFYMSLGFQPTNNPIPALFELEPEDIHMVKLL